MLNDLIRGLERDWRRGVHHVTPGDESVAAMIGLDRAAPGYDWCGLARPVDPLGYEVVIQVTFQGFGEFIAEDGTHSELGQGRLFAAVIPSAHRYRRPSRSPCWYFWWCQIRHPEAVARIEGAIDQFGHVYDIALAGPLFVAMKELSSRVRRSAHEDALAIERDVLVTAIEFQRLAQAAGGRRDPRWDAERPLRERVMRDLRHPPSLGELAAACGCSESAFCHRFRAATGMSPVRFVTEVRLEAVRQALRTSDAALATIADEHGFADANHLCKVFRRHCGQSPGAWRSARA
ncbi:MAG: helix-turn-helix transcriptional regulator [Planctomycetota bacterium]|jgi:AraC-like DNA-binding protein|nr:helix-turn-helix transcriptional regulator [Planctomycetota bacterium]